jgi:lipoprotein-anchoring transpeptidase ErfK/SrfK
VFAQLSPAKADSTGSAARLARVEALKGRITAYIDSLRAAGVEEVFTLGRGGNAPQDPLEKMNTVLDGSFRNPEALRISTAVRRWGSSVRREFAELGQPLIDRVEVEKGTHTARFYNGETLLLDTPIAVGNPEIGKDTPAGSFHVLYVDWRPISRWIRGNVPYGHEYNPYGARQIPFYKDWTLHGNNAPSALGKDISKGCVRFHNAEILVLAELVLAVRTNVDVRP